MTSNWCEKQTQIKCRTQRHLANHSVDWVPENTLVLLMHNYTVSKNDTDVAHYNFNIHQLILVIFGRDVAERVCCQMVICITDVSTLRGET